MMRVHQEENPLPALVAVDVVIHQAARVMLSSQLAEHAHLRTHLQTAQRVTKW